MPRKSCSHTRPDVLIFDFDGTLFDTSSVTPAVTAETIRQLRKRGVERPVPPPDEVNPLIGLTSEEFWRRLLPESDDDVIREAMALESATEQKLLLSGVGRLYPGVKNTLCRLRELGYHLYVASVGGRSYLESAMKSAGILDLFSRVLSGPDKAALAAEVIRENPGRYAVMIGDRLRDIEAGVANGIPTVACAYGFGRPDEFGGADFQIGSFAELPEILESWGAKGIEREASGGALRRRFSAAAVLHFFGRAWKALTQPATNLVFEKKNIIPLLARLSLPVMVTQVLFMLYDMVDAFWVGRLGVTAPAAVSLVGNLNWVFMVIGELVVAGNVALVAQSWGAGDEHRARHVATQSLLVSFALSLVIGTLLFVFAGQILRFYQGISDATRTAATAYLRVMSIGLAFSYVYGAITSTLQAAGDTVTPMKLGILSNVLNIVLDPFLIFGWGPFPEMGVLGAGVATVIGMGVYLIGALYVICSSRGPIRVRLSGQRPDFPVIGRILSIGMPSALYGTTRPLSGMLMFGLAAQFGDATVAAFGIGGRLWSIVHIFLAGFFVATATMVGQLLGAGKKDLTGYAVKRAAVLSTAVAWFVTLLTIILARPLTMLFLHEEQAISACVAYLRIVGAAFFAGGLSNTLSGAFKGAGRNWPTMISAFIANWLIKVPLAYLLASRLGWGSNGIWIAVGASMIIEAICLLVAYRYKRWDKVKVEATVEG